MSMRSWLAARCLQLALRLDSDLPLHALTKLRDIDPHRGLNATWAAAPLFPDHHTNHVQHHHPRCRR